MNEFLIWGINYLNFLYVPNCPPVMSPAVHKVLDSDGKYILKCSTRLYFTAFWREALMPVKSQQYDICPFKG